MGIKLLCHLGEPAHAIIKLIKKTLNLLFFFLHYMLFHQKSKQELSFSLNLNLYRN